MGQQTLSAWSRFVIATLISWPMMGVYMLTAHNPRAEPVLVSMPGWVPFWPAATPIYVSLLLVTWLLPVAIREARNFWQCQLSNIIGYLLVMPWWVLLPTRIARPPILHGAWTRLYELLIIVDPPTNIRPCAHGIGPVIAVWFFTREHPQWRVTLLILLVLALPSIFVTYQHRPIDLLTGGIATLLGILITQTWRGLRFYPVARHAEPTLSS